MVGLLCTANESCAVLLLKILRLFFKFQPRDGNGVENGNGNGHTAKEEESGSSSGLLYLTQQSHANAVQRTSLSSLGVEICGRLPTTRECQD